MLVYFKATDTLAVEQADPVLTRLELFAKKVTGFANNMFNRLIRVRGQLAGKRAFDGIFAQIKALFVFDAAHRAQKGTQIWAKRTRNAFCKLIVHTPK